MSRPSRTNIQLILLMGVAAVSSAAVLIRLAEAPALAVAAYRTGLASLVVLPASALRSRSSWRGIGVRGWSMLLGSGLFLALHFGFWIASLGHTSVASSVVIVTANPILVAAASSLLLREGVPRRVWVGIGLGLLGGVVIGWGGLGADELYGDGLALLGAIAVTSYYILGRRLRESLPMLAYVAPVYGAAALALVVAALASGTPLGGFPSRTFAYLVLIAAVPQLIGHSSLNWTLGHLGATYVAAAVMAEPVVATLLAWAVLAEPPPMPTVAGGTLILAGVYLALRR